MRTNEQPGNRALTEGSKSIVRYCPECGRIGEVGAEYRDCCPDGSHAVTIPIAVAEQARDGFLVGINAERWKVMRPFQCFSTNDGDSWYESPDDAELLAEVGAEAVGDEFEVLAGWDCVTARYRVIKTPDNEDDDFKVECITRPSENCAQQPTPEGMALVPIEPTQAMLKAADEGDREYTTRNFGADMPTIPQGAYDHYCAMLAAAQGERK